jgi:hypothetical protein
MTRKHCDRKVEHLTEEEHAFYYTSWEHWGEGNETNHPSSTRILRVGEHKLPTGDVADKLF